MICHSRFHLKTCNFASFHFKFGFGLGIFSIMAWYRREKLVLDGFRSLASRVRGVPKNPTFQCGYLNLNLASRGASFNGFSSLCSISQRLGTRGVVRGVNRNFHNPFLLRAKNFHNVHHSMLTEPRRRCFEWFKQGPVKIFILISCGGLLGLVCCGKFETIPFTERKHLFLVSPAGGFKLRCKGKMLASTHPESVRATMICKDIIGALQRGSGKKQLGSDLRYASVEKAMVGEGDDGTETFVLMSKEKGQESVSQSHTSHLDEWNWDIFVTSHPDKWNWEIVVVNEPVPYVACLPGGKIIVFTGLLTHFKSDAEIATIIGHEVAHAVAHHVEESLFKKSFYIFMAPLVLTIWTERLFTCLCLFVLMLMIFYILCFQPHTTNEMEIEADYIGLRLLALAGYDPRVAPGVYERGWKKVDCEYHLEGPLKRDRTLSLAQAMEDALIIYNDIKEGMVSATSGASSAPSSDPSSCSS